jgi:hypothetical protein
MKKILTIVILIALFTVISALEVDSWTNPFFSTYTIDGETYFGGRTNLLTDFNFENNLRAGLGLNLIKTDKEFQERNSTMFSRVNSYVSWDYKDTYLYTSFNNTLYADEYTNVFQLDGLFYPTVKPVAKNNLTFLAKQAIWNFDLEGSVRYRNLYYDYLETDDNEQENDLFTDLMLSYKIIPGLSVFGTLYYKDDMADITNEELPPNYADNDPEAYFDELSFGGGVAWKHRFNLNHAVRIQSQYLRRDGDTIPEYMTNYFLTDMRYIFSLTPNLNGFVSYINRGVFDKGNKEFYRVANVIRTQFRYQLSMFDERAYAGIGVKYNPENKSDRYYIEASYPIISSLAVKLADAFSPEYYNNIVAGLEYSIGKYNRIYVENTYTTVRSDITALNDYNLFTFGARFFF